MFKCQFAAKVKSGEKRQTVRPIPKRIPVIGQHESWREWTGLPYRSKQRELAQVEITGVREITITQRQIVIVTRSLSDQEEWAFAKADGFNTPKDLYEWFNFTHRLPFTGILILAQDLVDSPAQNPASSVPTRG